MRPNPLIPTLIIGIKCVYKLINGLFSPCPSGRQGQSVLLSAHCATFALPVRETYGEAAKTSYVFRHKFTTFFRSPHTVPGFFEHKMRKTGLFCFLKYIFAPQYLPSAPQFVNLHLFIGAFSAAHSKNSAALSENSPKEFENSAALFLQTAALSGNLPNVPTDSTAKAGRGGAGTTQATHNATDNTIFIVNDATEDYYSRLRLADDTTDWPPRTRTRHILRNPSLQQVPA